MKSYQKYLFLSLLVFSVAHAQVLEKPVDTVVQEQKPKKKTIKPFVSGDYTARYFGLQSAQNNFNVSSLQGALTINTGAKIGKNFSLNGTLVQTPALGKRFYTIYDFNKPTDIPAIFDQKNASILPSTLFVQKVYAQFENENTKVQVGTIPLRTDLSSKFKSDQKSKTTNLENGFVGSNAWVDGAKITHNIASKNKPAILLTLTVGALDQLSTEITKRTIRKPNYAEATVDFGNCKGLIAEGSIGVADEDLFLRTGLEDFIKVNNDILVKVYGEGMYNVSENAIAAILGYQTDLMKALNPKLEGRMNLGMEIAYIDPKIGVRGSMANDAFLSGQRFRIQLSGKIDKSGKLTWFAQKDMGTNTLTSVGLKRTFKK